MKMHICDGRVMVGGFVEKWTNYGKGWKWRWFMLSNYNILSYAKITRHNNTLNIIHLKISSFRESKSDDRRFYIYTATKTLYLRSGSKRDREAWLQALGEIGVSNHFCVQDNHSQQIMLSDFSHIQSHLNLLSQHTSNLLHTFSQFQALHIDAEASGITHTGDHQLTKHHFSSLGRGKHIDCSTTESSDDVQKQELESASDEDETPFYDTREYFIESTALKGIEKMEENVDGDDINKYPHIERRKKLPDPIEKEKGVSLWSMIKDNVGKDLTRVCLPVYFNEPISSLQKCCEDLEYSFLLDRAYQCGKAGNSLERALNVAAFAVSAYASSEGRHCKPFNPLLGETYEGEFPDKGIRFFSEKVSHHPTLIACHCEGRGWKFWAESNLRTKFWGRSIQLDPVGDLSVEFDDGEVFKWNKVTTTIYNLILGKVYCDHHGNMHIRGNREYSCKLKFKEQSLLDRSPRQVTGFVEDISGKKYASVFGKWDDSMYYANVDGNGSTSEATLLWKRIKAPQNLTRYNLTLFAITLNELTSELQEKLPPTDSRLRPDQRHLENGEYDKANSEKQRLEKRQRMSSKLQESGWKPRWFARDGEQGAFRYAGGYWESRNIGIWDNCPDIFGDFDEGLVDAIQQVS